MKKRSIFAYLFHKRTAAKQKSSSSDANNVSHQQTDYLGTKIKDNVYKRPVEYQEATKHQEEDAVEEDRAENANMSQQTAAIYNLIILDESGSMSCVRSHTISGCNETLNSIRKSAKEHENVKQYASIYCFDTTHSRYIFQNIPIEQVHDLTADDYRPNACTPLYDAIGLTVSSLRKLTLSSDTVGNVTIITDGLENASYKWNHRSVVELISSLKAKGWVFTFIGANIDVEDTAKGLGIDSYIEFEQTDGGMGRMFEKERRSREAYNRKISYMRQRDFYRMAEEDEKEVLLCAQNESYFMETGDHVAPNVITQIQPNQVFVFGSNIYGRHNGGSARFAVLHFGAINGQAEGAQGQSYAIPTIGNTFQELKVAIERFTDYVVQHPKLVFMLTAVGCGNAGYTVEEIAPLFSIAYSFGNVYVPAEFIQYLDSNV